MIKKDLENRLNRSMLEKQVITKAFEWKQALSFKDEKEYISAELELIRSISNLENFEKKIKGEQ